MAEMTPDTLRTILSEVSPANDWSNIGADQSLAEAGLDSLDKASFILRVEEETGRSIPDDDFDQLDTLRSVASYLERPQEA